MRTKMRAAPVSMAHRFFIQPFEDVRRAIDAQVVQAPHLGRAVVATMLGAVVTWWIYVPIHELLHALGCYATGGGVTELQIAPEYGGALFARMLPFVVSGGDYAGRLSGFDTHGSDLVYLATDAMPFVLTVMIGVPLLQAVGRGQRPALFGAAVVLGLAPFYCLSGDYYEMGSIIATRLFTVLRGSGILVAAHLRSDDLGRVITQLWVDPAVLTGAEVGLGMAALIVTAGVLVGALLAFATYYLGTGASRLLQARRLTP